MGTGPLVSDHMSEACHSVAATDPITQAKELMQFHAIRHLPVLAEGQVVGMVSLGDLYALEAVMELDPDRTDVSQAMSKEVYTVAPSTPLVEVAQTMAERHIGSAIVLDDKGLAGVFTASDACRVLGDLLSKA